MRIKKLWTILPIILVALFAISLWTNFRHNTSSCRNDGIEIWAHRGAHTEFPENSSAAVERAYETGFKGVEIDVFFDEDSGLVVSHDYPYKLVDGQLVNLYDVIYGYSPDFRFWIDLKNLKQSNFKKIRRAFNAIAEHEPGLRDRIYIESGNGRSLRRLNGDFNCIYWVQFKRSGIRGFLKLGASKFLMSTTDFEGITTDHRYIDDKFRRHFKNKCWYVFTVNEEERLDQLNEIKEVKVVLTDLRAIDIENFVNELETTQ